MTKKLISALALAAAIAVPASGAFASDSYQLTKDVREQVRTALTEQGYDVRKIKAEKGLIEAYVIKDGVRQEIYLNSNMEIVKKGYDD
jgi:hypothetical protein